VLILDRKEGGYLMSSDDDRGGTSSSFWGGLGIFVAFHDEEEWELQSKKKGASRDSRMEARHVMWT
jgi:hypothetical protein